MDLQERSESPCEIQNKKRGRPSGKNRVPLSLDERRARNAQYERERRHAASEAMSILSEATGCDPTLSNAEVLVTAFTQLQKANENNPKDNISDMKRINHKLILQVEALEQRLSNWDKTEKYDTQKVDDTVGRKRKKHSKKDLKKVNKRSKTATKENFPPNSPVTPNPVDSENFSLFSADFNIQEPGNGLDLGLELGSDDIFAELVSYADCYL